MHPLSAIHEFGWLAFGLASSPSASAAEILSVSRHGVRSCGWIPWGRRAAAAGAREGRA